MSGWLLVLLVGAGFFLTVNALFWFTWTAIEWWLDRDADVPGSLNEWRQ